MGLRDYGDDDGGGEVSKKKVFDEFDCPVCDANNPYGDGFMTGETIRCFYCGTAFDVRVNDSGKLKLREA